MWLCVLVTPTDTQHKAVDDLLYNMRSRGAQRMEPIRREGVRVCMCFCVFGN